MSLTCQIQCVPITPSCVKVVVIINLIYRIFIHKCEEFKPCSLTQLAVFSRWFSVVMFCMLMRFKVITYINEARQRGLSPRSPVHCLLIIVLDKWLRGDALPVESGSESCSVFAGRKNKNKQKNEAKD